MICKECGAYNPDHATFCKVCAANLKEQAEGGAEASSQEVAAESEHPAQGSVQSPSWTRSSRVNVNAEPVVEEPAEEPEEEEAEEAKPLEVEPGTARWSRKVKPAAASKASKDEDDDEDDYDDSDEDDEDDDEDEDDDYEEYEPTPPRKKAAPKAKSSKKDSGGVNIVFILIGAVLLIIAIMVCIVVYCNVKGGDMKSRLPDFLEFNCAGKEADANGTATPELSSDPASSPDASAPVTGETVDYTATALTFTTNANGEECIKISVYANPGETVTLVLPNQDDYVVTNTTEAIVEYGLEVPKICFNPNAPLDSADYTVTPEVYVTTADGSRIDRTVESFTMTFPTINLALTTPASVSADGIMAESGNKLHLEGTVDDHTVEVYANDQKIPVYDAGVFQGDYTMTGTEAEEVVLKATKDNYVSSSITFTLTPYVFVPETMTLTVSTGVAALRADASNKVKVTGTTVAGATLTAASELSGVVCGSVTVDAEGNYSFEATFDKTVYNAAKVTIHAVKDGYEEAEAVCFVTRSYVDRKAMITGNKGKYYEVYGDITFAKVIAEPSKEGAYRFAGKVVSVEEVDGYQIVCFAAKTAKGETTNIYVMNQSTKWNPATHVGSSYKLYCTLNGLYTDGTSLYVICWFALED